MVWLFRGNSHHEMQASYDHYGWMLLRTGAEHTTKDSSNPCLSRFPHNPGRTRRPSLLKHVLSLLMTAGPLRPGVRSRNYIRYRKTLLMKLLIITQRSRTISYFTRPYISSSKSAQLHHHHSCQTSRAGSFLHSPDFNQTIMSWTLVLYAVKCKPSTIPIPLSLSCSH